MKKRFLNEEEILKAGITIGPHEMMENDELRFRITGSDGSGYIRTVATSGGWQNSHFHKYLKECYCIQNGWLALAVLSEDGELKIKIYKEGSYFVTKPGVAHNIYMNENSVIHTVKFGQNLDNKDWFPSKKLDEYTKKIDKMVLLQLCKKKNK